MYLLPNDVRSKQFSIGRKGYRESEVDEFLDSVIAALEDLLIRADDLDVRIPGTPPAPCLPDFEMRIDPLFDHAQAVRG